MGNELTIRQVTPAIWETVSAMAPTMHRSRLFGVNSAEQAAAIMIKGWELGLSFSASFEFIHVVEGKPSLSPRGALALILNSDKLAEITIDDDKPNYTYCEVYMKRTNGFSHRVRWSMDDAKRAGVVKPGSGWEKYPANMLKWRAVGFCADVVFPDVIGGMKRADELGAAITPDGDVIAGEWKVVEPVPEVNPAPAITLDSLVSHYGAEIVLGENGGIIPSTQEEVERLAAKLAEVSDGS